MMSTSSGRESEAKKGGIRVLRLTVTNECFGVEAYMTFKGDWTLYVANHEDVMAKVSDWLPVPRKGD